MGEGELRLEEIFFSRTDTAGRIVSGNDVFTRVSGYSLEAMIGRPHSLIRHPDTPRAVFSIFWEVLEAGLPVAAYVKNRTRNDRPYWVMASAFPVAGGYLSIRVLPTSPLLAQVQDLYSRVQAAEVKAHEGPGADGEEGRDGGRRRDAAVAAGRLVLDAWLHEHGYADYETFMRVALAAEVGARRRTLDGGRARLWQEPAPGDPRPLAQVLLAASHTHADLRRLVGDLSGYEQMGAALVEQSRYVRSLAEDVRVFSFNALFASTRLGHAGIALAATASQMRDGSNTAGQLVTSLSADIDRVLQTMTDLQFRIANAQLRVEATACFTEELLVTGGSNDRVDPLRAQDLVALTGSLERGLDRLLECLLDLDSSSRVLLGHVSGLGRELDTLNVLQMNGRVEAARVSADASVTALFSTIGEQVRTAMSRMDRFSDIDHLLSRDRDAEADARAQLTRISDLLSPII